MEQKTVPSRLRRGWELTKSTWHLLLLETFVGPGKLVDGFSLEAVTAAGRARVVAVVSA